MCFSNFYVILGYRRRELLKYFVRYTENAHNHSNTSSSLDYNCIRAWMLGHSVYIESVKERLRTLESVYKLCIYQIIATSH